MSELAKLLGSPSKTSRHAQDLVQELGRKVRLPAPEIIVSKNMRRTRRSRRKSKEKASSSGATPTWRSRRRPLSIRKRQAQRKERYQLMGTFAEQWYKRVSDDPGYRSLKEPISDDTGDLMKYLGLWGHSRINLNTASVEVIEVAFSGIGMNGEVAQEIVDYRTKKPLTHISQLKKIDSVRPFLQVIQSLSTIESDSFSVEIKAQSGRSQYFLLAGIYINMRGQLVTQGVFSMTPTKKDIQ